MLLPPPTLPPPGSLPAPRRIELRFPGRTRRPLAQVGTVAALITVYGHFMHDKPFTLWNPTVLFLVPFLIGLFANKGFARPFMAVMLVLISFTTFIANAVLFSWVR